MSEDPMSLKYVLPLTVPERQWLTRIARGRGARPRPALWKVERARALLKCDARPEGAGWTDAAIAAALDVSADSVGRWRCQAVTEGPKPRGPASWRARAKRISCSWPSPRRPRAMRAGVCVCSPARWPRAGSWPKSATKPCVAR